MTRLCGQVLAQLVVCTPVSKISKFSKSFSKNIFPFLFIF